MRGMFCFLVLVIITTGANAGKVRPYLGGSFFVGTATVGDRLIANDDGWSVPTGGSGGDLEIGLAGEKTWIYLNYPWQNRQCASTYDYYTSGNRVTIHEEHRFDIRRICIGIRKTPWRSGCRSSVEPLLGLGVSLGRTEKWAKQRVVVDWDVVDYELVNEEDTQLSDISLGYRGEVGFAIFPSPSLRGVTLIRIETISDRWDYPWMWFYDKRSVTVDLSFRVGLYYLLPV